MTGSSVRRRPRRSVVVLVLAAALALVAAVAIVVRTGNAPAPTAKAPSVAQTPSGTVTPGQRFDPDHDLFVDQGMVYLRGGSLTPCVANGICATVTEKDGHLSVSVPFGYFHGDNPSPRAGSLRPIETLSFGHFHSGSRQVYTTRLPGLRSVTLPDELRQDHVQSMTILGASAWTEPSYVRQTTDGVVVQPQAPITYVPLTPEYYPDRNFTVKLTRTQSGFDVCVIGARLLVHQQQAKGIPGRLLQDPNNPDCSPWY
jgi:hypothetical protein